MAVLLLNNENFKKEISSGIILVDFWAEWCGPCQMMLPILSNFESEMGNKIKVGKVNVDEAQELAQEFRIMSVPTMLVFKDGQIVEQLIGVRQKEDLKDVILKYL